MAERTSRLPGARVLVADDDEHILELVGRYLTRAGFEVETAADGDETMRRIRERRPDLVVLDVLMPGPDGFEICRRLGPRPDLPIIFLTARTSEIDRVAGLRMGADDYVTKPFNPNELVARVESVLRRTHSTASDATRLVRAGALVLDRGTRRATAGGRELALTSQEFDLLSVLASLPNAALDRDQLLDYAWGTTFYSYRTVDVHVARLRTKLAGTAIRIETVWGVGYRLVTEERDG
jgi:two-component system, OmpR family, response regulator ResD